MLYEIALNMHYMHTLLPHQAAAIPKQSLHTTILIWTLYLCIQIL